MRRDLDEPGAAFPLPERCKIRSFNELDARELHALLELAYADDGGGVLPFGLWWVMVRGDDEFSSENCLLVENESGRLVAAALCWGSGFVKDFVVHPDYRRRQIASCLLSTVFSKFAEKGVPEVRLKVLANNRSAIAFYRKLGMQAV